MTMIAKSVLVALGLFALASGAATAAPALATRDLTVRAQPAGAAPVVGRIPGGSTVDARNCRPGVVLGDVGERQRLRDPQLSRSRRRIASRVWRL